VEGDRAVSSTVVEALGPGASTKATVKWSLGEGGKREVQVHVDTDDSVEESIEDDNAWPDSQEVTFEEGSPGPGPVMTILAVTLVALTAYGRRRR